MIDLQMVAIWLMVGLLSTFIAILVYRRDGRTKSDHELYYALVGVCFGPATIILVMLDAVKSK